MVTPSLFRRYRSAADFAAAASPELERLIHSTGFFRNKAKNIRGAASIIESKHGGRVPDTMDALLELPGVARKTANVVLGVAFGKADGVVVDTHVTRLARRLGFTSETRPEKIERDLMKKVPREKWIGISHRLILHGRGPCKARKPDCAGCTIFDLCDAPEKRGAPTERRHRTAPAKTAGTSVATQEKRAAAKKRPARGTV
jgi:endonuclease-3